MAEESRRCWSVFQRLLLCGLSDGLGTHLGTATQRKVAFGDEILRAFLLWYSLCDTCTWYDCLPDSSFLGFVRGRLLHCWCRRTHTTQRTRALANSRFCQSNGTPQSSRCQASGLTRRRVLCTLGLWRVSRCARCPSSAQRHSSARSIQIPRPKLARHQSLGSGG